MSSGQGLCRVNPARAGGAQPLLESAAAPSPSASPKPIYFLMLSVNIIVVKQLGYLSYHSVCVCHLQELCAALCISKRANPQAVGRMKLLHEEIAAYLNDLG